jgi:hypothetical protein
MSMLVVLIVTSLGLVGRLQRIENTFSHFKLLHTDRQNKANGRIFVTFICERLKNVDRVENWIQIVSSGRH